MRYTIQVKVLKGENDKDRTIVSNSSTIFLTESDLKVSELKQKCKEWYDTLPIGYQIIEEKLYMGSKEKKDDNEVIGIAHGLEYNLIFK